MKTLLGDSKLSRNAHSVMTHTINKGLSSTQTPIKVTEEEAKAVVVVVVEATEEEDVVEAVQMREPKKKGTTHRLNASTVIRNVTLPLCVLIRKTIKSSIKRKQKSQMQLSICTKLYS